VHDPPPPPPPPPLLLELPPEAPAPPSELLLELELPPEAPAPPPELLLELELPPEAPLPPPEAELTLADELPPEDPPDPDELELPEQPLEIIPNTNVIAIAADWTFMERLLPNGKTLLVRGGRRGKRAKFFSIFPGREGAYLSHSRGTIARLWAEPLRIKIKERVDGDPSHFRRVR
jgi:hypothetical protein